MKRMKKGLLVLALAVSAALCLLLAACGSGVVFKFETGEGAPSVPEVKLEAGQEYTLPTPEWDGYSFEGWYLTEDFTGDPVVSLTADEGKTFYAKWEKMYRVTLDPLGGTLSATEFYLKAGDDLGAAAAEYIPQKDGLEFGEWLYGEEGLGEHTVMPKSDVELKAHYKVGYTIEVYLQSLADENVYEQAEDVKGFGYPGDDASIPQYEPEGFERTTHTGEVLPKQLSENAAENAFKLYFDRKEIVVYLNANVDNAEVDEVTLTGKYGEETELPADLFYRTGYLLSGWSESASGDNAYAVGHEVFNADPIPSQKYTFTESTVLFAVWQQGYTDLFGGLDYIYPIGNNVYLERAGFLFLGQKRGNENLYTFSSDDEIVLSCKIFNGTFCYADESRQGYTANLYTAEGEVDTSVTLYFSDTFNGLSYSVKGENDLTTTSSGTYYVDETGYFHTEFTSGNMVGHDFAFMRGTVTDEEGNRLSVFVTRNEEEYGLGVLTLYLYTGEAVVPYEDNYQLILDGFGTAAFNNDGSVVYLYYGFDDSLGIDMLVLYTEDEQLFGTFIVSTFSGVNGYMFFDPDYFGEFAESEGSGTLVLDGTYRATYTDGTTSLNGSYVSVTSQMGADLIYFDAGDEEYVFSLSNGYFEKYDASYAELLNSTEEGIDAPILVVNKEKGKFELYAIDNYGMYLYLVARGTIAAQDGDRYLATVTEHLPADDLADVGYDYAKLSSFVYSVAYLSTTDGDVVPVMYWWSYTLDDGEPSEYEKKYTPAEGKGELTVVNGFGYYTDADGEEHLGLLIDNTSYWTLSCEEGDFYFSLDDATSHYTILDGEILGTCVFVNEYGETDQTQFLTLDGLGGAVYEYESDGSEKSVKGKIAKTSEQTIFEYDIYTFTATDGSEVSFNFIMMDSGSSYKYFFKENTTYAGEFTSNLGETLTLDGYFLMAYYSGPEFECAGLYYLYQDAWTDKILICLYTYLEDGSGVEFFFDVTGKTISMRGDEYLDCYVVENQDLNGEIYCFDGLGHLTVRTIEGTGEDAAIKVIGDGSYTYNEAEGLYVLEITYTGTNVPKTVYGGFSEITLDGQAVNAFLVCYTEVVNAYLNEEDWSVLMLGGFGSAYRFGPDGYLEFGSYVMLSETLLYYVNDDLTDALLYEYDAKAGRIVALDLEETGYYTENLEALLFTSHGFVLYQDERLCFYNKEADGSITLYYSVADLDDYDESDVTKYGYVAKDFGKFTDQIDFEGKTYYKNDGISIIFKRTGNTNSYPIPVGEDESSPLGELTFAPSDGDFAVTGTVQITISGTTERFPVSVVRTSAGGESKFYIYIGSTGGGFFRYTISLTYHGENSTYSVTAMDYVYQLSSYYSLLLGIDFGQMELTLPFTEAGEESSDGYYLDAVFVDELYTDLEGGSIVSIDHAPVTVLEYDDGTMFYIAEFEHTDKQTYRLYFEIGYVEDTSFYYVLALVRVQMAENITCGNEVYDIELESMISSDSFGGWQGGDLFSVTVYYDDAETEGVRVSVDLTGYIGGNKAVLFEYDLWSGMNDSTAYVITVKLGETDDPYVVPLYTDVQMIISSATYYYTAANDCVVMFYGEEIGFIAIGTDEGEEVLVVVATQSLGDGVYEATTSDGYVFTVTKQSGGTVTVEEKIVE